MKQLIVFDLDGTLAQSKAALDGEMAVLLTDLLDVVRVAVISGGAWPQFQKQLLDQVPREGRLERLSLLPTCGTKFYSYDGRWELLYSEDLSGAEKAKIIAALSRPPPALRPGRCGAPSSRTGEARSPIRPWGNRPRWWRKSNGTRTSPKGPG